MSLKSIINYISKSQITNELIARLNEKKEINIIGSSRYAKALVLSEDFFKDLVNDAKATALSAESNISRLIKIGSNVRISDQLSI